MLLEVRGPRGATRLEAIVDTTAPYCLLPAGVLEGLGYDVGRAPRRERLAGSDERGRPLFELNSLTGLGLRVENCPVAAFEERPLKGETALVGLSFLRHFRFTLDLPGGFYALRYSPYYHRRRRDDPRPSPSPPARGP